MYPTLLEGDIVTVDACSHYQVNDVLVVNVKENLMIHRVIDIKTINNMVYYLTKGDNNSFIDRWQSQKSILGKVTKLNNVPFICS